MIFEPGSRLGPYEVVSPIGAGGMGEVYRARDTTLRRDVALKVLPDAFASDADRIARFEREAQVLATLNHPNIAASAKLMATSIAVRGTAIEAGTPMTLFQPRIAGGGAFLVGSRQQYDVAPDGRFLINVETESSSPPITLLLNWKPRAN